MRVCVAGATGFVGRELCQALAEKHLVVALTRRSVASGSEAADGTAAERGVIWRSADLFSLLHLERALQGADLAVYLVHSMLPPSRLTQGRFEDLDVILADNFARAAKLRGIKRIIYLGGIIPPGELSLHLRSRREVEHVLAAHGAEVVTLRAGLVIGPHSSSFRIMERLVDRLPIMTCPRWTSTRGQPIALQDVVEVLCNVIADPDLPAGAYDIAGPDVLSYMEMMRQVSQLKNVRRQLVPVPFVSPAISRLWVSTVTQTPRALVYPLIESLQHDMVARDCSLQARYKLAPMSFAEAVKRALAGDTNLEAKPLSLLPSSSLSKAARVNQSDVTSVQRLPVPPGHSVCWVAGEYAAWLPSFFSPWLKVETTEAGNVRFIVRPLGGWGPRLSLLEFSYSADRSSQTRQLYYLTGGLLLRRGSGRPRGRLEFRAVPGQDQCLAAVLDFRPSLPWWIYRLTQAQVHLIVMRFFARHLRRRVVEQHSKTELSAS